MSMRLPLIVVLIALATLTSSCSDDPLSGLEYERISDNAILVKSGIPYQQMLAMNSPQTIHVFLDEDGEFAVRGKFMFGYLGITTSGEFLELSPSNCAGQIYVFDNVGMQVIAGEHRYTSNQEAATISYRADGVEVLGFDIKPIEQPEQPNLRMQPTLGGVT